MNEYRKSLGPDSTQSEAADVKNKAETISDKAGATDSDSYEVRLADLRVELPRPGYRWGGYWENDVLKKCVLVAENQNNTKLIGVILEHLRDRLQCNDGSLWGWQNEVKSFLSPSEHEDLAKVFSTIRRNLMYVKENSVKISKQGK